LLRCAGFNNVDLVEAKKLGVKVMRVPGYSPYAVAEHAVALVLALNRKIPRAVSRVREMNFSLEGLVGFDVHGIYPYIYLISRCVGKTIGVLGTGRIGAIFAEIMRGFGCTILAYDVFQNADLVKQGLLKYVSCDELYAKSDIISVHVPLLPETLHLINETSIAKMKKGSHDHKY